MELAGWGLSFVGSNFLEWAVTTFGLEDFPAATDFKRFPTDIVVVTFLYLSTILST